MSAILPFSNFHLTCRVGSIDGSESADVNVASDFMALYTTRQKYRRPDMPPVNGFEREVFGNQGESQLLVHTGLPTTNSLAAQRS